MPRSHGVALADAAEVDAHARRVEEAPCALLGIEQHVAVVDARQRRLDLGLGRVGRARVVVQVADARVGDVERAFGDLANIDRRSSIRSNSSGSTATGSTARGC